MEAAGPVPASVKAQAATLIGDIRKLVACGMCEQTMSDPHVLLSCRHKFCRNCIFEHLAQRGCSQCPSCKVPAMPEDMKKDLTMVYWLEAWHLFCQDQPDVFHPVGRDSSVGRDSGGQTSEQPAGSQSDLPDTQGLLGDDPATAPASPGARPARVGGSQLPTDDLKSGQRLPPMHVEQPMCEGVDEGADMASGTVDLAADREPVTGNSQPTRTSPSASPSAAQDMSQARRLEGGVGDVPGVADTAPEHETPAVCGPTGNDNGGTTAAAITQAEGGSQRTDTAEQSVNDLPAPALGQSASGLLASTLARPERWASWTCEHCGGAQTDLMQSTAARYMREGCPRNGCSVRRARHAEEEENEDQQEQSTSGLLASTFQPSVGASDLDELSPFTGAEQPSKRHVSFSFVPETQSCAVGYSNDTDDSSSALPKDGPYPMSNPGFTVQETQRDSGGLSQDEHGIVCHGDFGEETQAVMDDAIDNAMDPIEGDGVDDIEGEEFKTAWAQKRKSDEKVSQLRLVYKSKNGQDIVRDHFMRDKDSASKRKGSVGGSYSQGDIHRRRLSDSAPAGRDSHTTSRTNDAGRSSQPTSASLFPDSSGQQLSPDLLSSGGGAASSRTKHGNEAATYSMPGTVQGGGAVREVGANATRLGKSKQIIIAESPVRSFPQDTMAAAAAVRQAGGGNGDHQSSGFGRPAEQLQEPTNSQDGGWMNNLGSDANCSSSMVHRPVVEAGDAVEHGAEHGAEHARPMTRLRLSQETRQGMDEPPGKVEKLGGTLLMDSGDKENQLRFEVTHLVTEKRGQATPAQAKRTVKYFAAVLRGSWIVTKAWFDASLTASEWVDEGRYSLDADSKYAGAPSKGRAAKQNKAPGLFASFRFCFYGDFTSPTQNELKILVHDLGGAGHKESPHSEPEEDMQDIIVCGGADDAKGLAHLRPVRPLWILDSISNFKPLLPLEGHPSLLY